MREGERGSKEKGKEKEKEIVFIKKNCQICAVCYHGPKGKWIKNHHWSIEKVGGGGGGGGGLTETTRELPANSVLIFFLLFMS